MELDESAMVAQHLVFHTEVPDDVGAVGILHLAACLSGEVEVGVQGEAGAQPVVESGIELERVDLVVVGGVVAAAPLVAVVAVEAEVVVLGVEHESRFDTDAFYVGGAFLFACRGAGSQVVDVVGELVCGVDGDVGVLEVGAIACVIVHRPAAVDVVVGGGDGSGFRVEDVA